MMSHVSILKRTSGIKFIIALFLYSQRRVLVKFHPLSQEELQSRKIEFREKLRTVYRWGKERGLSMEAVAGSSKSQLSRVLALGNDDPSADVPDVEERNLSDWCYVWYINGVINPAQVDYIMNLGGHASPFQQRQAITATTEQRAISVSPRQGNHAKTEEMRLLNTNGTNGHRIKENTLRS